MRFDEYAITEGMKGISNVLKHFQMITEIEPKSVKTSKSIHLKSRRWLRAPTAGMFIPEVINGGKIKKRRGKGKINGYYKRGKGRCRGKG